MTALIISPSPHDGYIRVPLDDGIKLEPRSDGKGEAKLRRYVHIELVFLLAGTQTPNSVSEQVDVGERMKGTKNKLRFKNGQKPERLIGLVKVWVGEGDGCTQGQVGGALAGGEVEDAGLEAGEALVLE